MTDWLERACREFSKKAEQATANTDVGFLMAVTAVPSQRKSENSVFSIGSNGSADALLLSEIDGTATSGICLFDVPSRSMLNDDRRTCYQCLNLTPSSVCLSGARGEIPRSRIHLSDCDLLQRCVGYSQKADDPDQRSGHERWPGLIRRGIDHVGNQGIG